MAKGSSLSDLIGQPSDPDFPQSRRDAQFVSVSVLREIRGVRKKSWNHKSTRNNTKADELIANGPAILIFEKSFS